MIKKRKHIHQYTLCVCVCSSTIFYLTSEITIKNYNCHQKLNTEYEEVYNLHKLIIPNYHC